MLDVDHGTYPFVTSARTPSPATRSSAAASGRRAVDYVLGISKAYSTRVGGGPYPTELKDETGERLRKVGSEFGATTGRPRRTGWLDALALRYAARVNGLDGLALTKLDVLTGFEKVKIAVGYEIDGKVHRRDAVRPRAARAREGRLRGAARLDREGGPPPHLGRPARRRRAPT